MNFQPETTRLLKPITPKNIFLLHSTPNLEADIIESLTLANSLSVKLNAIIGSQENVGVRGQLVVPTPPLEPHEKYTIDLHERLQTAHQLVRSQQ